MSTALLVAATAVVVAGLVAGLAYRRATDPRRALASDLDDRLSAALGPGTGSHLERAPRVRRLAAVDRRDGEPLYAPIVRLDLETTDAPGTKLLFEYVADVLEVVHPALEERGERVARYDVEFTFGPDGLFVEGECRRVTVPPALADRLLEDDRYRAHDLRKDVERGDRDDETITTLWGECRG